MLIECDQGEAYLSCRDSLRDVHSALIDFFLQRLLFFVLFVANYACVSWIPLSILERSDFEITMRNFNFYSFYVQISRVVRSC